MMSLGKIIFFTFIAGLVAFELVENGIADVTAVPEFFGKWYTVGIILEKGFILHIACKYYNVSPEMSEFEFYEMASMYVEPHREKHYYFNGVGSVIGSTVLIHFMALEMGNVTYNYRTFNNRQEVMLIHESYKPFSELISRTPTASAEAKRQFEKVAADANSYVFYVVHENCTYTS